MASLRNSSAWQALAAHQRTIAGSRMRDLFAADAGRFNRFSLALDGLLLDYSKNSISRETMRLLCDLARQAEIEEWRDRMFSGRAINTTEGRPVLHVALRNRSRRAIEVDGEDVMAKVEATLGRMLAFAEAVRDGSRTGATGKPITDVVNIGIGGSHLGPAMACRALNPSKGTISTCISSPTSTPARSAKPSTGWTRQRPFSSLPPRASPALRP